MKHHSPSIRSARIGALVTAWVLGLFVITGSLLALPADYCKICYNLGEYGGPTCLNVGSGFGFNTCYFTIDTYYVPFEGRTIELEIPRCHNEDTCTFVY